MLWDELFEQFIRVRVFLLGVTEKTIRYRRRTWAETDKGELSAGTTTVH